jgi:hypothetical protein
MGTGTVLYLGIILSILSKRYLYYVQEASLPTAEPKMTRAMAKTLTQAGDVVPWIGRILPLCN